MKKIDHSNPNILVVDDEPDIRDSIAEFLRLDGYTVSTASNGVQALKLLKEIDVNPVLIILDIQMPEMNGLEFLRRRRGIPRIAPVPVLVLTCNEKHEEAARALGVNSFLQKPVEAEVLLAQARSLCQTD